MASIHYIIDCANYIEVDIIQENKRIEPLRAKTHYAVLTIQRHTRATLALKSLIRLHEAATTIQKYARRFLVKINMPKYMLQYLERSSKRYYNKMATRIQAAWRGYLCRAYNKELFLKREQERLREANNRNLKDMAQMKNQKEHELLLESENEAKHMVLFILFKIHHLLRTSRPGILSDLNTRELSWVEKLLKSLRFTTYMKELRKLYNKNYSEPTEKPLILKGVYRKCERAYYQKYKGDEAKPTPPKDPKAFSQNKRFNLHKSVPKTKYEQSTVLKDKYKSPLYVNEIMRDLNKSLNISTHDFDTTMKKSDKKQKVPDYFVDFWTKICEVHSIPEMF